MLNEWVAKEFTYLLTSYKADFVQLNLLTVKQFIFVYVSFHDFCEEEKFMKMPSHNVHCC